jgi:pyridoxal phosphate enzyme (YggS family)
MNPRLAALLSQLAGYPGVTVVAVSKEVGVEEIRLAYEYGFRHFGENRMQDALAKQAALDLPISWHFVGRLQTNKVRLAAGRFALYHSLSGLNLAEEMNRIALRERCSFPCLVQVNASREQTKQGLALGEVADFLVLVSGLPGVKVLGLMTIGPHTDDRLAIRRVFREVRALYDELKRTPVGETSMLHLSMGMSSDYELALDEGATMLRIGSAIFSNLGSSGGMQGGR